MQKSLLTLRELELLNKLVIARESSERRNLKTPGTLAPSCWRFLPPCFAAAQPALPSRWGPFHTASYHLRKIRLGTRRRDKASAVEAAGYRRLVHGVQDDYQGARRRDPGMCKQDKECQCGLMCLTCSQSLCDECNVVPTAQQAEESLRW